MKTISALSCILLFVLGLCNITCAQMPNASKDYVFFPENAPKHELFITPWAGFGEMPILESHLDDALYYDNIHSHRLSPSFGCSVDFLLTGQALIGIDAAYQTIPFSTMNIVQPYYYGNISDPYTLKTTPEFGASFDYLNTDNTSFGFVASYQVIQCSSVGSQPFYPSFIKFSTLNLGFRSQYYFQGRYSEALDFYVGGRISLSIWTENDNWDFGYNSAYVPIIISSNDNLNRPNNTQLSLLFYGGMRYFFVPAMAVNAEIGFGFGTPYYAQCGLVLRLFHKKEVKTTEENNL